MASWRCVRPVLTTGQKLALLGDERGVQALEARDQRLLDRHRRRELERGRDDVVRALAAVDVVIRVDRRDHRAARWRGWRRPRSCSCWSRCRSPSGRCRSGTGRRATPSATSPAAAAMAAATSASSRPSGAFVSAAATLTSARARMNRRGNALPGDREVEDRALGGRAVQGVGRDLHLAHRIARDARGRAGGVGHGQIVGVRSVSPGGQRPHVGSARWPRSKPAISRSGTRRSARWASTRVPPWRDVLGRGPISARS